jgi:hypothetical protein
VKRGCCHSNIAAIHGLEEIDSRHFLVMELVSGNAGDIDGFGRQLADDFAEREDLLSPYLVQPHQFHWMFLSFALVYSWEVPSCGGFHCRFW